ncbi:unnamed protein product [Vicia faba]|uniref:Uncharacterized protein n=1 Tax=Vicia faba TaxID=3906 RepID=A0AAV1AFE5_VICFA|nr:unnamed protein product [Vicia faba]
MTLSMEWWPKLMTVAWWRRRHVVQQGSDRSWRLQLRRGRCGGVGGSPCVCSAVLNRIVVHRLESWQLLIRLCEDGYGERRMLLIGRLWCCPVHCQKRQRNFLLAFTMVENATLVDAFPEIFEIANCASCCIVDVGNWVDNVWTRNLIDLVNNMDVIDHVMWDDFKVVVQAANLVEHKADTYIWMRAANGIFKVK